MIIGVGSWRGLGATTTAFAAAASLTARGERPWLVEADPAGGVLAARLDLGVAEAGSLERIAFPVERTGTNRFDEAAIDIAGIRVITTPGDPFRAWACHTPRFAWQSALRDLDGPVVVDLGTLRGGGPNTAVLQQLDLLLLVVNRDAVSVVSSLEWAGSRGRPSPDDRGLALDITRMVIVDAPTVTAKVSRTDVESELGERFAGALPWSPDVVELMYRGTGFDHKRLRRHAFTQAADHLAGRLCAWLGSERAA